MIELSKNARDRLAKTYVSDTYAVNVVKDDVTEVLAALDSAVAEVAKLTGCRCETLDASEGGGTDEMSCPEHAYEAGRRHERSVCLDERTKLAAVSESALSAANASADAYRVALEEVKATLLSKSMASARSELVEWPTKLLAEKEKAEAYRKEVERLRAKLDEAADMVQHRYPNAAGIAHVLRGMKFIKNADLAASPQPATEPTRFEFGTPGHTSPPKATPP